MRQWLLIRPLKFTLVKSLTIALVLTSSSVQAKEQEGTRDAGGGNAQVGEFFDMARSFAKTMEENSASIEKEFPVTELKKRMQTLKVEAVKGPLELGGLKVDAINHPLENRIELDDVTWSKRSVKNKYRIVVHEILGLLTLSDEFYDHSARLAEATFDYYNEAVEQPHAPVRLRSADVCRFDYNLMTTGTSGVIPSDFSWAASVLHSEEIPVDIGWNYTCGPDRIKLFIFVTMTKERAISEKCLTQGEFESMQYFVSQLSSDQVALSVTTGTKSCTKKKLPVRFVAKDLTFRSSK